MCFRKKGKKMSGKHHKPKRVKVILSDAKPTGQQKKWAKEKEAARRKLLKALDKTIAGEDLARLEKNFKRSRRNG